MGVRQQVVGHGGAAHGHGLHGRHASKHHGGGVQRLACGAWGWAYGSGTADAMNLALVCEEDSRSGAHLTSPDEGFWNHGAMQAAPATWHMKYTCEARTAVESPNLCETPR